MGLLQDSLKMQAETNRLLANIELLLREALLPRIQNNKLRKIYDERLSAHLENMPADRLDDLIFLPYKTQRRRLRKVQRTRPTLKGLLERAQVDYIMYGTPMPGEGEAVK